MGEKSQATVTLAATAQDCIDVATDFESYPNWSDSVKSVEVVSKDEQGRGTEVKFTIVAMGKEITYSAKYDYSNLPNGYTWVLGESDIVTQLDGSYEFEENGDEVNATYSLEADLSIPMPGFMKKTAVKMLVDKASQAMRAEVSKRKG